MADVTRLVLVGGGHAHVQVLRAWARDPLPGVALTLVAPQPEAEYSGMVPGWLAGRYPDDAFTIALPPLCREAGAQWVRAEMQSLDPSPRMLTLSDGQRLGFDLLSLNVGSTLQPPPGDTVLSLRPLAALRQAWPAWLARWSADTDTAPARVTAVGGGAAGVECLLAVLARLRALRPDRVLHGRLVSRAATLLPGYAPGAVHAAQRALARAGVTCALGTDWHAGLAEPGERVLWATGALAHAWQRDPARRGGLAVADSGFVRVDTHLRSVSHPQVFAVGDCAEWAPPLPKSGVHAVRMGPALLNNLRAALGQGTTRPWQPQRRTLALLATADGRAIASRGGWSAEGRWVMRWKHWLDTRFVRGAA